MSPFYYDDGDALHIAIEQLGENDFRVSDEGTSLMRLSYDLNIEQINNGTRKEVIDSLVDHYGVNDRIGEYIIRVDRDNLTDAIFRMMHFCIRIADIDFLNKQNVRNTFIEDFKREAHHYFSDDILKVDWFDKKHDESAQYSIDILIEKENAHIGIFPMHTNYQVMSNTITIHQLRTWGYGFSYMGVVENERKVSESNIKKFTDVSSRLYNLNEENSQRVFEDVDRLIAS